ncbi:MAG: flippase [Steroidobacteraceae bacterium]
MTDPESEKSPALLPDSRDARLRRLTSGAVLVRSSIWNLAGQTVPLVVAIPALPFLIGKLGIDRFGVLTLIWVAIGYFSLFDLGMGRALTQLIARRLGEEGGVNIGFIVRRGLALMLCISILGSCLVWFLAPWLARQILNVPVFLEHESIVSLRIVAVALPFIVTSSGLTGILMAYQRFGLVNVIRIPAATLSIVLPVVAALFSPSLEWTTTTIVLTRIAAWAAYATACMRAFALGASVSGGSSQEIRELIRLGGWISISNVVGPVLVYLDRFVIAGLISAAAVAYYSTPYEVITKLWIVPGGIVTVLFSAFATSYVSDKNKSFSLFVQGTKYVFFALFPIVLGVVLFSSEVLNAWLGAEFAHNSTFVLQILALGVLVNSLALVPNLFITGVGQPDKVAKIHLVELVIYLPILVFMTARYGIDGAALAWAFRVTADAVFLYAGAFVMLPAGNAFLRQMAIAALASCAAFGLAFSLSGVIVKLSFLLALTVLLAFFTWNIFLKSEERSFVRSMLSAALRPAK